MRERDEKLHDAVEDGDHAKAAKCLRRGADVDSIDCYLMTPLINAITNGDFEMVKLLLDNDASVDKECRGSTPLHTACEHGKTKIVKILLKNGAGLEKKDKKGMTPLFRAARAENLATVEFLLSKGADKTVIHDYVKAKDKKKKSTDNDKANKTSKTQSKFFELLLKCASLIHDPVSAVETHAKLGEAVSNLPELKIYYTLLKIHILHDVIEEERGKLILSKALSKLSSKCSSEDALVAFKLIQNKCQQDGMLSEEDFIRFDNRAEVKRMEHADFIIDMKVAIQENTDKIAGMEGQLKVMKKNITILDKNLREVNRNVNKMKSGLRYKMRVEAGVSAVSMCLSAVTFGIGGGFVQLFSQVVNRIVDFGDSIHIRKVIDSTSAAEQPAQAKALKYDLNEGIELANKGAQFVLEGASSILTDQKLEEALRDGRPMLAIGFAAAIISPPSMGNSKGLQPPQILPSPPAQQNGVVNKQPPAAASQQISKADFALWPDAVFDNDKEDPDLELHFAVKYCDKDALMECLNVTLFGNNGEMEDKINETDSAGRTALDLAALTGQLELLKLLEESGGKHKQGNRPLMRAKAKKRSDDAEKYKEFIFDDLE